MFGRFHGVVGMRRFYSVDTKHLMTGPKGNSEFCFSETLNPRGTLRVDNTRMSAYDFIAKCYRFAAVSNVHDLITSDSKVHVFVALGT